MTFLNFIFAANLTLLAADHFLTGSLALLAPRVAIRLYEPLFGARLPDTPEYLAILKPWGALGIFAGGVGLLPMLDAHRYRAVLIWLLILLACRLYYRSRFQKEAQTSLGLNPRRNLFHLGLIAVCAGLILGQLFS